MIEFNVVLEFTDDANALREAFPQLAEEIDKCLFEVLKNHTPKCGHGNCSCQTMTSEQFHLERNLKFGTTSEAKSYEVGKEIL